MRFFLKYAHITNITKCYSSAFPNVLLGIKFLLKNYIFPDCRLFANCFQCVEALEGHLWKYQIEDEKDHVLTTAINPVP